MTYYTTTDRADVQNYPYGYNQKTTATFGVEFKKGKGFRTFFQSVNPKTGALNKPKHSTYSPVIVMGKKDDGHIGYKHLEFYGDDGIVKDIKFMADNFDLFTPDQIKNIASYIAMVLKADIIAKISYCGIDQKKICPLYRTAINTAIAISKDGHNLFDKIIVDFAAVDALKVKGFNPFKVTSYGL